MKLKTINNNCYCEKSYKQMQLHGNPTELSANSARIIGNKEDSLSGAFTSSKNNKAIQFESSLELDFAEILEFDFKVKRYISQPAKIRYKQGIYYPDFLVIYTDYAKNKFDLTDSFFEIKYAEELKTKKSFYERKYGLAKETINSMGYDFNIITEDSIRTPYLINIKFLNYYVNQPVNEILKEIVISIISNAEITTPKEVMEKVAGSFYEKAHATFIIWHLVANRIVFADIRDKLILDTEIWIN